MPSTVEHRPSVGLPGHQADCLTHRTIPQLFSQAAEFDPDAVALIGPGGQLTYAELDRLAWSLSDELVARGIGLESVVAISMQNPVRSIIAMLAVMRAGGGYLALDRNYPADRLTFILADAAPELLLTDEAEPAAGVASSVPTLCRQPDLPRPDGERDPGRAGRTVQGLSSDNLAYVVYTSGSSGVPKGVAVSHRGMETLVAEQGDRFEVGPHARVLQFASLSFDASVSEIWVTLLSGATLVCPDGERVLPGEDLLSLVERYGVTHLTVPPSALRAMAPEDLPGTTIIVAGEECPAQLAAQWSQGRRLINAYGPTETTVCATMSDPLDSAAAPIGRPLAGRSGYVLDAALRPAPEGEFYVSGVGLARGYLGRSALTAERFVADPFTNDGQRMYRTGDLLRCGADGVLEFVGRADAQVKIRGFRVEPAEVEARLSALAGVAQAVVVAAGEAGARRLLGYVSAEPGAVVDGDGLRRALSELLPDYLVPAAIAVLDRFPLTANGKIDRNALPAVDGAVASGRRPRTRNERVLCEAFAESLGLETVGLDDDFFSLGGDSILAIKLISVTRRAGLTIKPRDIFRQRTVLRLAAVASQAADAPEAGGTDNLGPLPRTPIMNWLAERTDDLREFYQSITIQVPAEANLTTLAAALQAVMDHHDALRLQVIGGGPDDAWSLLVAARGNIDAAACLVRADVSNQTPRAQSATFEAAFSAARARLDPAVGVMLQAVWFDNAGQPGKLLLVVHHLGIDGVSWRILLPDLQAAFEALAAGRTPQLPAVHTSLRKWARQLQDEAASEARMAEMDYWRAITATPQPQLGHRPLDPALDTAAVAETITTELSAAVTEAVLSKAPRHIDGQVNDVLLAGLTLAAGRWLADLGERGPLLVSMEGHGREDIFAEADLSRTVGWFTTVYPVLLDTEKLAERSPAAAGPSVATALAQLKEQLSEIPDHGIGYSILRYLPGPAQAALSSAAPPQIAFDYLGRHASPANVDWQPAGEATGLLQGDFGPDQPVAHSLEIGCVAVDYPTGPRLITTWTWPPGVFDQDQVSKFAAHWEQALQSIADQIAGSVVDE